MSTRMAVDPDDEGGTLRLSHPFFAGLTLLVAIALALAVTWIEGQVELPMTWFGSAALAVLMLFLASIVSDGLRMRKQIALAVIAGYLVFAYFLGGEEGKRSASAFAAGLAISIVLRIRDALSRWWKPATEDENDEPDELSPGDMRAYKGVAILGMICLNAILFTGEDYYGSRAALESVFNPEFRFFANPALAELIAIVLLGPAILLTLWKLPIPSRGQALFVLFALLTLSCMWNAQAWLHGDQAAWVLPGHALACALPIVGVCIVVMMGERRLSRTQFSCACV